MCGRQGLPRRGCWSKRYATRACRSSEKSAASEGVKLADMHDVMASCAHVTRLERSDAACDRMPQSLRHSECQVGGRSGDKDASPYSSRQSTKEWSSSLSSLNVA